MKIYNLFIISAFKTKTGKFMIKGYTEQAENVERRDLAQFMVDIEECNNDNLVELLKDFENRAEDIPMIRIKGMYANYRFYLAE